MTTDPIPRLNAALEGRYRIGREIGAGGMATVFLADDLRHERKVALKLLQPELAAVVGAERFLTEIKTTANLQHPHILPLFDSGEADGFLYYVMPYVEGESLREKLDRETQLPVEEAVRISTDVAEALEYAHKRGVIHRDIKPANILIHADRPLVADFGIALALSAGAGSRLTETGLSLGTPHYMSPEQATGDLSVGPATDIWALGCVLYEMLVGEPPFTGSTPQAVLGKIITARSDPVRSLRSSVPMNVEGAIEAALERVPADRFPTAADFARALNDPAFAHRTAGATASGSADRRFWLAGAAATAFAILAAWGWLGRSVPGADTLQVSRTTIALDGDHRLAVAWEDALPIAISPDGSLVAYVGESASGTQLYVRPLDSFDPTPLAGTADARQPFFSPDGREIGYFDRRSLNRVPVSGGGSVRITELPTQFDTERPVLPAGGAWGPDGTIVFAAADTLLWRVSVTGGEEPTPIRLRLVEGARGQLTGPTGDPAASLGLGAAGAHWPYFLPGAPDREPEVLLKVGRELVVVSIEDGMARPTGAQMSGQGLYVSSGHIIATETNGQVLAIPFDLQTRTASGAPVPLFEDVFRPAFTAATALAVAPEAGVVVFVPGGAIRTVLLVDRGGRARPVPSLEPRDHRMPSFSPDGTRLAIDPRSGPIQVVDLQTGGVANFPGIGGGARWSPDGEEFATGTPPQRMRAVPGAPLRPIVGMRDSTWLMDWGRDGRILLHMPYERSRTGTGIYIGDLESGQPPAVLIDGEANENQPRRSPNGRWLVYVSDASGRAEVYIRELDGPDGSEELVSIDGGSHALWSRDGSEIFFWRVEELYSVRVLDEDPLQLASPELLFEGRYHVMGPGPWDVSPSGDFALISSGPNWRREIRVIQNLSEELRRLAPN